MQASVSGRLWRWLGSPWVGLIGVLATIAGLTFGVYTYLTSQRFRQLTFHVFPVRTEILKSGEFSAIHVLFRGHEIHSDVTGAQIAVWNQGKEPVYRNDVLRPIAIVMRPRVPILEATLRKVSRQETGFVLDVSRLAEGSVILSWDILEQNDGASVQLIYAGPPNAGISVEGTIVGQRRIRGIELRGGKIRSPAEQLEQMRLEARVANALTMIGVLIAGLSLLVVRRLRARGILSLFLSVGLVLLGILLIILALIPTVPPALGG